MVFYPVLPVPTPGATAHHRPAPARRAGLGPALAAKPGPPALPSGTEPASAGASGQSQQLVPASLIAAVAGAVDASPPQGPAVKLLFVYNADAGLVNGFKDLLHKTFSPETYECALCATTYQLSGMRPEWKQAVAALPLPTEFLHRDEFWAAYPAQSSQPLPAAYSVDAAGQLTPFISTQEMNTLDLPALTDLVQQRARALMAAPQ